MTASDVLVECLIDWGVEVIFGLPGDGIDGVMESLRTHQDEIRFIQVRHEESAAFMACGYAKYTGKLGACLATSGPGGIHLLNGLYDAKLDGQPIIAITGMQHSDLIGTNTQQDVALDKLYIDVAVFNERVMSPAHMRNMAELACRTALSKRGVAHITIPVDVQSAEIEDRKRSKRNVKYHTNAARTHSYKVPDRQQLQEAARILNEGRKVAILAGRGALGCDEHIEQLADLLAAPVVKPLLGKGVLPDDSPFTTGSIGLLGTGPSQEVMEKCETLLMIGTSFPYIEFLPKPGQAKCVQIDIDPTRIALRYPADVGLVGDSATIINELIPLLKRKHDRGFLKKAQEGMKDWWDDMKIRGTRMDKPMKPQVVAWELGKRLRNDAIISCDSGTIATWWARQIIARRGQMFSLSGNLATMAPGLPYTIAAQVAYPGRQCVGFVGDGGFSMLMADFVTAVKYKLPIKIVVIKNNELGQIKWEQMVLLGNPQYEVELAPIDFAAVARACGGVGYSVDDPTQCGDAMEEFLNTPGPALLEAVVDPLEPPLPGKIKAEQAAKFAKSLARGEPDRGKIIATIGKDKIKELV